MSKLYIVATPIGNLEDISLRALRILGEVDFVLCEDTRTSGVLLNKYNIKTPTISYHQHSGVAKTSELLKHLEAGKSLALVSDAGTPGISDPGGMLVQAVLEKFGDTVEIESIPGPSAVTAALSISGIQTDKFLFLGFPPHKKGRETFIKKIIASDLPVVVYESKHRIIKFLEEINKASVGLRKEAEEMLKKMGVVSYKQKAVAKMLEDDIKKTYFSSIVVCRELSKMHETVYRGDIKSIIENIKESPNAQKGEFVVIIGK